MEHRDAVRYLPNLGMEPLGPALETEIYQHLKVCNSCRDWLATRRLVRAELCGFRDLDCEPHATSELLALCVIRPEEIQESDRSELRSHLENCSTCRADLRAVRAAVMAARPDGQSPTWETSWGEVPLSKMRQPSPLGVLRWHPRLAAVLVLVLGAMMVAWALFVGRLESVGNGEAEEIGSQFSRSIKSVDRSEVFAGSDLEGSQTISGAELFVSDTAVKSGADVTFRAEHGLVAFGDGFYVASGAKIRVDSSVDHKGVGDDVPRPRDPS